MTTQEAEKLIEKYNQGLAITEEVKLIEHWYLLESVRQDADPVEIDYLEIKERVWSKLSASSTPVKSRRLWPRIATAAAAATIVFGVGLFYYNSSHRQEQVAVATVSDVIPGKQGATLTLASGQKIRLADAPNGKLTEESGVVITKSTDGELAYEIRGNSGDPHKFNTLTTANGETYHLRLPDGSEVWLNAASSLTYRALLNENGKRVVKLTGEGYFEIAKDKNHPFVVQTANQNVEVLGTHFNINSYADEPAITTTLVEGAVRVVAGDKVQNIVPGQQAINNSSELKVVQVNTANITDWKDGEFNLDVVDFRVAMRKIARWYDVELVYDPSVPVKIEAFGWISRNSKLSSVLKLIENSGQVKFRIEGKKVLIYK